MTIDYDAIARATLKRDAERLGYVVIELVELEPLLREMACCDAEMAAKLHQQRRRISQLAEAVIPDA